MDLSQFLALSPTYWLMKTFAFPASCFLVLMKKKLWTFSCLPVGKPIILALETISVHFWVSSIHYPFLCTFNTFSLQVFSHQKCKYHPVSLVFIKTHSHITPSISFLHFTIISQKRWQHSSSTVLNSLQMFYSPSLLWQWFIQRLWPKN